MVNEVVRHAVFFGMWRLLEGKAATALLLLLLGRQPAVEGLPCGLTTDEESCCLRSVVQVQNSYTSAKYTNENSAKAINNGTTRHCT